MKKRKDGRVTLSRTVDGKRIYASARTAREARIKLDANIEKYKAEQAAARERKENPGSIHLNEYFQHYQDARRQSVKPVTLYDTQRRFSVVSEKLGSYPLDKITKNDVLGLRESLSEKYSTCTVNTIMTLLSSVLKMAMDEGVLTRNPCSGVKQMRKKADEKPARETTHRALSRGESNAFLNAAKERNSWYENLLIFMLHTGMRVGEAAAVKPSDCDFKAGIIHVRRTVTVDRKGRKIMGTDTKSRSGIRDVPMVPAAKDALKAQMKLNEEIFGVTEIDRPVFRSVMGALLNRSNVDTEIKKICKAAGIEDVITSHALRATFATRCIEAGMNPKTLQEILGHANIGMTMNLYAHVMPETKVQEMAKLTIGL